jgi:phosphatidylinositol alpha-mannosyltransferase
MKRRPLRVGIVVPYDLAEPGGGVKHHALALAASLRALGDRVVVFGPASHAVHAPNVVAFRGVINVRSNGGDNRMGLFVRPWAVRRAIEDARLDVLHVHEPLVPSIGYWSAWGAPRVPKVATFHAFAEDPPIQLRIGQKIWGRTLFPFFARGVAVSEPAARYASIAWKRPLEIIPNGVDTNVFAAHRARGRDDRLRVLFVGKLSDERKGFRYLLDAHRRLLARGVRVSLDVVGETGSERRDDVDHVTWHGPLPLGELVRRYQSCDVFVAPSTSQESFGIVLLEAMSTGAPVVCSDIDGYRRVVHPSGARRVPPRDPEALASAIESLAHDPLARRAMEETNVRHARDYDWSRIAPRVREVYLSAMEGAASVGNVVSTIESDATVGGAE